MRGMRALGPLLCLAIIGVATGCPSSSSDEPVPAGDAAAPRGDATPGQDSSTSPVDAAIPSLADKIRARLSACKQASAGLYKTDDEAALPEEIPVCEFGEAYFWKADMDIDCDGQETTACSLATDAAFQPDTTLHSSMDEPLDASVVPYVVVPSVSARFDFNAAGIEVGAVVMVIYQDKVEYGVFADTGPVNIIGEASYAMANLLGINPDPSNGGTTQGEKTVHYVVFKGKAAVVQKPEDHNEAVTLGKARMNAVFPGL
jgi:hypothetical protein